MDKAKYYVEYWAPGDDNEKPIATTFSIAPTSLVYFLRQFVRSGKHLVHVQELEGKGRILMSKRRAQHAY